MLVLEAKMTIISTPRRKVNDIKKIILDHIVQFVHAKLGFFFKKIYKVNKPN